MIAYFDSSAIVALLLPEPGTMRAKRAWLEADRVTTSRVSSVEVRAALAAARRARRIRPNRLRTVVAELQGLTEGVWEVPLSLTIASRAGDLAEAHALRGYDAIHLASAEAVVVDGFVLVAGDRALLTAASRLGMATVDTTAP